MKTITYNKGFALSAMAASVMLASSSVNAELMISEYVEGSGYNKALELYNTSQENSVDLSDYQLVVYRNGAKDNVTTFSEMQGTLKPGHTYVIVNKRASGELKDKASLITNSPALGFNGDDPVEIQRIATGERVDILGVPGASEKDLENKTLARKADVKNGSQEHDLNQWEIMSKNSFSGLGYTPDGEHKPTSAGDKPEPEPRPDFGQCNDESITPIHEVQGKGFKSPLENKLVTVQGVVTAVYDSTYFVQQTTPASSEYDGASLAIQVYDSKNKPKVNDVVYIRGIVKEYKSMNQKTDGTMTQLTEIGNDYEKCRESSGIKPTSLLFTTNTNLESYEGMQVSLSNKNLYISSNRLLNRYGNLTLALDGVRQKPNNLYLPSSEEAAQLRKDNARNSIVLDDGSTKSNPATISYYPNLSDDNPLRVGTLVNGGLKGILRYAYDSYQLIPAAEISIDNSQSLRPESPEKKAPENLRIASFNVLNYFNGLRNDDGTIDWKRSDKGKARGANSAGEFATQRSKIINAIHEIDADILGLLEVENDGYGEYSAIQDLVNGLNKAFEDDPETHYEFVRTSDKYIGQDVIKVAMIYNTHRVEPEGEPTVLKIYPFDEKTKKHRQPIIQTFKYTNSNEPVTVAINHFKSKGSSCDAMNDPKDEFGQGNCNRMRVSAADTLGRFLKDNYDNQNVVILGDLNAYAQEDPVKVLTDAEAESHEMMTRDDSGQYKRTPTTFKLGYIPAVEAKHHKAPISFIYDGEVGALDHALYSPSLKNKVDNVIEWNINGYEMPGHDYNTEYKNAENQQDETWYQRLVNSDSPYRSSDHDPVIVDLALNNIEEEEEEEEVKSSDLKPAIIKPALNNIEEEDDESGSMGIPMLLLGALTLLGRRRKPRA
ncbi:ExeM/NucH family extracellular endonuclease [Endozoicomonas gorgoniicola]|uniref:ExeM/NucH family extracellular endonuclease n=1 Tax=Endozoicomonas gorgoniicola TaxID=1234144 RepID=A0ABT3MUU2_9GAMM|nr:ExeM/NucH family extracellular endonuclease [Endozoicomonas gorgoniicola]MCW7553129.1 ExeM/NucH family extracellular endonuclease [Endozoicomonas gorgoniicola]